MRKKMNSKRGAIGVFVVMILSSMIFAVTVIGNAAFEKLKESEIDGALRIGARSVLGEYDIRLKDDYGLFAYLGTSDEVAKKIEAYGFHNLSGSCRKMNVGELEVSAENREYSLLNCDKLQEQVTIAGKLYGLKSKRKNRNLPVDPDLILKNEATIKTLPTGGKRISVLSLAAFNMTGFLSCRAGDEYFINKYIGEAFKSRFSDIPNREGFFNYEVEYVISGKMSEEESLSYVKRNLFTLREGLNTAHILSDPKKMEEVSILAEGDPIKIAAIIAMWASAESSNDVKLLLDGKRVAAVKNQNQWAISLPGAVKALLKEGYTEPIDKSGKDYDEYLMALLYAENRETKLLRTLDLIQLNLRSSYNENLLIKEFYTGFDFTATADGKEYGYAQYY